MTRPSSGQMWPRVINPAPIFVSEAGVVRVADLRELDFLANATVTDAGSGVAEVTPTGGGAGATTFPNVAPDTPSAFDDEFEAATLDPKWTEVQSGNAAGSVTDYDKYETWLSHRGQGSATASQAQLLLRQALSGFAAGTALTVTARVALRQTGTNTDNKVEIGIGNNSTYGGGSYVVMGVSANGTGAFRFEVFDGAFDVQTDLPYGIQHLYIHFQRNASNSVRIYVSNDGVGWRRVHTETRAWDASFLFLSLNSGATGSQYSEQLVDWVRVNDARFLQPDP